MYARIADICRLHGAIIPLRQIAEMNSCLYTRPEIKIPDSNNIDYSEMSSVSVPHHLMSAQTREIS